MKIIKIGEKEYVVKFTMNSLVEMEQYLGKPVMSIFKEDEISFLSIRTLTYFGLKQMEKELTHEKAGDIMSDALENGMSFQDFAGIIIGELTKALGMKAEITEKN